MELTLSKTVSENNKVIKTLTNSTVLAGTLRAETSVLNPVIMIETESNISQFNYAHIDEFNRYYFITNITSVRKNLWRLDLRCDVLMSYSSDILALSAVIKRQESAYNLYINDNNFMTYNYPRIQTAYFPSGFTNGFQFVLTTVGKTSEGSADNA